MLTYLLKRMFLMIPTLIGITIVTFVISRMAPGDPVQASFGGGSGMSASEGGGAANASEQMKMIEERRKQWGLDLPYHIQYGRWIRDMVIGDFGKSMRYGVPVSEKLWPAMKVTIGLNIISLFLIYLLSIPLGIHSAIRRGKPEEKGMGITLFALYSAPSFWVATLCLFYLCNPNQLGWFFDSWLAHQLSIERFSGVGLHSDNYRDLPYLAQERDYLHHLVLPILCMTYGSLAYLSRYARTGLLEVIRKDYVRTARAKGLPERVVILKHALRNSLIPIVTLMASLLPAMIGGSVIVEYIFTIPGMGMLSIEAVLSRDYNVIMAIATLSAILTLIGMLMSDVLYTVVDPRIRLD